LLKTLAVVGDKSVEPKDAADSPITNFLDSTHSRLSTTITDINEIAHRIDTFFVDKRSEEAIQHTRLRIRLGAEIAEGGRNDFYQRVSMNLRFPQITRQLQLAVNSFSQRERFDESAGIIKNEDHADIALRYILREKESGRLQFGAGMTFSPEPNPYGEILWRAVLPLKNWNLCPAQFLFWERDDGYGETTRIDLERGFFNKEALFRVRGEATYSEISSGVDFKNYISYSRKLSENRGYSLAFVTEGHTRPSAAIEGYRLQFTYRRLIYKDWLFIEAEPAIDFLREQDYGFSPGIAVQIEGIFTPSGVEKD
jgi:hypothetical protein